MTEQQPYDLLSESGEIEIRRYPAHVLAEVRVSGPFDGAGNRAFPDLFGYISGQNARKESIAMTAPVMQSAPRRDSEKIAMTAPVTQQADGDEFVVAFVLPANLTEQTAPTPTNPRVDLRTVPAHLTAAIRFSGRWTNQAYEHQLRTLLAGVAAAEWKTTGEPRFARFDPPFTPWFLRHNEICIDLEPL
jgi:effector-binding domain-containing protein